MADKIREQQVFENLKNKYIGLGDANTTKEEWMANISRDTYSNLITHKASLYHLSTVLNKPSNLVKNDLIEKMIQPITINKGDDSQLNNK